MSELRPHPVTPFEYFERGWRPLLAWSCGLIMAVFVVAILAALVVAIWKAVVFNQSVPDLTGGFDRYFVPSLPYISIVVGTLWGLMRSRNREVEREIAFTGQARAPFPSSAPAPAPQEEFQGVNPHGGPDAP